MLPPFRPTNERPITTPRRVRRMSTVARIGDEVVLDGVKPARLPVRAVAVPVRARPLLIDRVRAQPA
jgi:hypothetical protein